MRGIGCAVRPTGAPGCLQAGGDVEAPHLNGGTHDPRLLDKKETTPRGGDLGKPQTTAAKGNHLLHEPEQGKGQRCF